ncbi:Aminopeptidase N [Corynebacterium deserti GIMN1.010]|uniref:Aminopeptidase N n=1 Tax=Corynebacterium deserti GIMN1.010 TaxID=931089 RepID=A0A0M4CHD7_9CORY|nr:aminopeptidase N [Corynebacterium deserti]ALC06577.1 Aminopeptidase N [Corynebacterium deserti GIMN1.010]
MTSTNLTRQEAAERSRLLSVHNYDIALDLNMGDEFFSSTTLVKFTVLEAGDTFIDLRAARVDEVELDNQSIIESALTLKESGYDETPGIALNGLTPGEHSLRVVATIPYSRTGEGLHRMVDPADNEVYLYTQFETADAKRMFACFDQPDLKATYDLTINTPKGWKVISNAEQTVSVQNSEHDTHTSRIDYPLSTYLVAVCAGNYHEVRDSWSGELTHHPETPADQPTELTVPLGLYCRRSLAKDLDAERLFTETKQGFDWYHRNFGVSYPFGKYDQIFVPEFNAGAMENAGAVTIRDEYVFASKATRYRYERRADTILHELAHMWFGDLVTMKWWDDLWLNESFATWSAAISQAEETEYDTAWVTFANVEKSWAYQQDQLPSTHPVFSDGYDIETVDQNFDGITYAKGASVLKQLQAYVGREEFLAGVRRHFANHSWGNATFEDLLGALELASGRDLSDWANQWLKTTGINTLGASFEVEGGKYTSFAVTQTGAEPGDGELRTHRIAVGLYKLVDGSVNRYARVEIDCSGASTSVEEIVGLDEADFVLVNDDDLTYALLDLDERSREFVIENIDKFSDPMPRTLAWSAAWEMTRAGQMKARDFISLVARGASSETEIAVLERILMQTTSAVKNYADPTWAAETGNDIVANAFLDGARTAEADSDAQLAFIQALAKVTLNDAAASFFTDILSGRVPGLTVDSDLRWWALTALIAAGRIDSPEDAIAEELSRDNSSASHLASLRARAAINDADSKAAVYKEVTAIGNSLSNLELRHKIEGLTFTGSSDFLQSYNNQYFEILDSIWANFSGEMAQQIILGLFPSWNISSEGLERADYFLDGDHVPGVKRIVAESRDRVARALRNRSVDAS